MRDPKFYFSPVLSLYYDTPELAFYREVCNGDYLKTKVRLRWYCKVPAEGSVLAFLEIKQKAGVLRRKRRQQVSLNCHHLQRDLFSDATMIDLPDRLPEVRLLSHGILAPILVVEYQRHRFIDPLSGSRLSVDSGIGCWRANSLYLPGTPPVHLSQTVLEVKGPLNTIPKSLHPLKSYLRKQSFSKYARTCDGLMNGVESKERL